MTLRNRFLAVALTLMSGVGTMYADHVIVVHTGDSESSYQLKDVEEITFGEEGITVKTVNVSSPFSYSDISKIDFSKTPTDIQDVKVSQEGFSIYGRTIEYTSNRNAEICVYDISGKAIAKSQGKIDISALPHGIYVVRTGGQSFKVVR